MDLVGERQRKVGQFAKNLGQKRKKWAVFAGKVGQKMRNLGQIVAYLGRFLAEVGLFLVKMGRFEGWVNGCFSKYGGKSQMDVREAMGCGMGSDYPVRRKRRREVSGE